MDRGAKIAVGIGGTAGIVVGVAGGAALSLGGGTPGASLPPTAAHQPPTGARGGSAAGKGAGKGAGYGPATTVLATLDGGGVPGSASPGGAASETVPAASYGRASVLPVIATRPGWVRVRLARRPNGSTAWVPDSDVSLSSTPYRIVINLATMRLSLYDDGRRVFSAPAGVGTTDDPTPTGEFFVEFDEPPPEHSPGYGPFIMVTSAHSDVISDWEGSGDALTGIHGPLGDDPEIGTAGARVSHGCIRLHVPALERLQQVPPGTPVDVVG